MQQRYHSTQLTAALLQLENVKKRRKLDFSQAYASLEELDGIDFFTSRLFSAADIELPTTACVLRS